MQQYDGGPTALTTIPLPHEDVTAGYRHERLTCLNSHLNSLWRIPSPPQMQFFSQLRSSTASADCFTAINYLQRPIDLEDHRPPIGSAPIIEPKILNFYKFLGSRNNGRTKFTFSTGSTVDLTGFYVVQRSKSPSQSGCWACSLLRHRI